jgi:hypothetical protein
MKGGKVVMLENSLPGRADGHRFVVFKIDIENGREQLGEEIASRQTLGGNRNCVATMNPSS